MPVRATSSALWRASGWESWPAMERGVPGACDLSLRRRRAFHRAFPFHRVGWLKYSLPPCPAPVGFRGRRKPHSLVPASRIGNVPTAGESQPVERVGMSYEYKCVGAPEEPRRQRGVRAWSDRAALAMQEVITAEAVDGWEYLRTDLLPVEEKDGFFSRARRTQRAVLIFRREIGEAPRGRAAERQGTAPGAILADDTPPPHSAGRSQRRGMRLSAERGMPAPPSRGNRLPPSDPG